MLARSSRRRVLLSRAAVIAAAVAGAGLLPRRAQAAWNTAAFDARTIGTVAAALGISMPAASDAVLLDLPEIAENGAVVPVGVSITAAVSGVRRIVVMIEKNPATLAAVFELSDAIEPNVATRVKMAETCEVYGAVVLADGRVLYAAKEVKITIGGCGGA